MARKPMYTVADIATRWDVSPQRVRQWIRDGRLLAKKVGRDWLIYPGARRPQPMKPGIKRVR